jgi:hypothetical protein
MGSRFFSSKQYHNTMILSGSLPRGAGIRTKKT